MSTTPTASPTPTTSERKPLTQGELLSLRRWNTPTIYNGWEQISRHDRRSRTNVEPVTDYMPGLGPMVGYAITVVCEPSNPEHPKKNPNGWVDYWRYVASVPGPKIVVVQDLDKPREIGAFWGEVQATYHRNVGCVGTIIDGAIRDIDEMLNAGLKGIARRLCVGHAYSWPVRWNCEVEVFGCKVKPGDLIHADKHGFITIPAEDERKVLEASVFMDRNECDNLLTAGRETVGRTPTEIVDAMAASAARFGAAAKQKFGGGQSGEW
jgi:4-hydroxy-4-methyl-2-oxoglutarate aldolase